MSTQILLRSAALLLAAMMAGCTSAPPEKTVAPGTAAKKPPRTAQYESGRNGFQKVYVAARNWAPDARPIRLESRPQTGEEKHDGKATVWAGTFASPAKQQLRSFQWSGSAAADAPEAGIDLGSMDVYSPSNSSTQVFETSFLKVDTDAALAAANKKGGAAVLKKNPALAMRYVLFWDVSKGRLLWRVIYGTSESDSKLRIDVNASTGEFTRTVK